MSVSSKRTIPAPPAVYPIVSAPGMPAAIGFGHRLVIATAPGAGAASTPVEEFICAHASNACGTLFNRSEAFDDPKMAKAITTESPTASS